ncbi:hypothetical protein SESBI_09859 [Sesbania bispinosa]|nr:hypothetical protein SESBI_09859 [Sesbania bispinosa]
MNQQNQNQGFGSPSNVPMKRKRGRPRKEESVVQGENVPGMHKSDNVLNSNQTVGATADCEDEMVGKVVTGVIEGTFNAGYLLNVKVADTDTFFRGLVFLPGQVNPITAENDVAPHVKMIKRKEFPIPILNPQTEVHGSVPSSVQCSKQSFEPEIQVPVSKDQVLPTEIHFGNSVSHESQSASTLIPMADLPKNQTSISIEGIPPGISEPGHENQSASTLIPMADLPKNQTFISIEGIPPGISEPGHVNQSASTLIAMADLPKNQTSISIEGIPPGILEPGHVNQSASTMSELDCDKTVKQGNTLQELDASTQVKEFTTDGGAAKDSKPASEPINLVPTIENIDNELRTGLQVVPFVHQLNEVVHNEPNRSNIELNQIPISVEPESMPSEQTSKSIDNFVENQALPKTDLIEDTKTKHDVVETLSKLDTSNLNGPSSDIANILDVGSNLALKTSQPESMPSEHIGQSVPSESKVLSEGCDFREKGEPQNCSSIGDVNKVDFNQPNESLVNSMESENRIGSDT